MTLPDFLTTDQFGGIRLTGSRVALSQLMWHYHEGHSVEALQAQFPTLGFAQIHKVLGFYWDNKDEVDAYLKQAEEQMAEHAKSGNTLDVNMLRQRLAGKSRDLRRREYLHQAAGGKRGNPKSH